MPLNKSEMIPNLHRCVTPYIEMNSLFLQKVMALRITLKNRQRKIFLTGYILLDSFEPLLKRQQSEEALSTSLPEGAYITL